MDKATKRKTRRKTERNPDIGIEIGFFENDTERTTDTGADTGADQGADSAAYIGAEESIETGTEKINRAKRPKEGIQLTIIEQIEALMDEFEVNQTTLAHDIGMGQAQLSKCLSRKGNNYISIDTLIKLSDYFRVPVDSLLGRSALKVISNPQSNSNICRNLIKLIETGAVNFIPHEIEQDTYQPDLDNSSDEQLTYRYEKKSITYKMFYFSNYRPLPDLSDMDESEKEAAESRLNTKGLYHPKGIEINAFIEYYLKLRELYKNNDLPKPFFDQAIEDRLNQMRY